MFNLVLFLFHGLNSYTDLDKNTNNYFNDTSFRRCNLTLTNFIFIYNRTSSLFRKAH